MSKKRFLLLFFFVLLVGYGFYRKNTATPLKAEWITRHSHDLSYPIPPLTARTAPTYAWDIQGPTPITKEFFRCRGHSLHPPKYFTNSKGTKIRLDDCIGSSEHSLPIRDGKEFIYPCLIDLLNEVQQKSGKQVIITSGHRCMKHHKYVKLPSDSLASRKVIGAEVNFYVKGLESRPKEVAELIIDSYRDDPAFKPPTLDPNSNGKEWKNKEIHLKVIEKGGERDAENPMPHPYLVLRVLWDRERDEPVVFRWDEAESNLMRW